VINEFGATIGVLTLEDVQETIFSPGSSRSERLLQRLPIRPLGPNLWQVTGMTSLRRLARHFGVRCPRSKCVTVRGVLHSQLQRLPQVGDHCVWGPFHLKVVDEPVRSHLIIELRLVGGREGARR